MHISCNHVVENIIHKKCVGKREGEAVKHQESLCLRSESAAQDLWALHKSLHSKIAQADLSPRGSRTQ